MAVNAIMLQNISVVNKYCSSELPIHQIILIFFIAVSKKTKKQHNIDNKMQLCNYANKHIRIISEETCDTEDWSNGC